MDITLSHNLNLVLNTKSEVSLDATLEAFVESAPQFVLQLFIILNTGKVGEFPEYKKLQYKLSRGEICVQMLLFLVSR